MSPTDVRWRYSLASSASEARRTRVQIPETCGFMGLRPHWPTQSCRPRIEREIGSQSHKTSIIIHSNDDPSLFLVCIRSTWSLTVALRWQIIIAPVAQPRSNVFATDLQHPCHPPCSRVMPSKSCTCRRRGIANPSTGSPMAASNVTSHLSYQC